MTDMPDYGGEGYQETKDLIHSSFPSQGTPMDPADHPATNKPSPGMWPSNHLMGSAVSDGIIREFQALRKVGAPLRAKLGTP
jgi:hypothetical protein